MLRRFGRCDREIDIGVPDEIGEWDLPACAGGRKVARGRGMPAHGWGLACTCVGLASPGDRQLGTALAPYVVFPGMFLPHSSFPYTFQAAWR